MHPSEIHISDYTYNLPAERIAQYPLAERDASRLLVYNQDIKEDIFKNVSSYLPEKSLLVFNNTKVVQARLFFTTAAGAKVEVFCLEPADELRDMASAMSRMKTVRWKCLVGRASKWKEKVLKLQHKEFELEVELVGRDADNFIVEFNWQPEHLSFAEILDKAGVMPIPPYLHRQSEELDLTRYQTVYARYEGSVAAPTAGLHFTPAVLETLKNKQISTAELSLHVGAGTFKPVKSETLKEHDMHFEMIDVPLAVIEKLYAQLEAALPVIAVGTTSLRTLESLYWMGVKAGTQQALPPEEMVIRQWDPYAESTTLTPAAALKHLLRWMELHGLERLNTKTQILISPPYRLKIAQALITNFHQPNSTLLLLVAAVVGAQWRTIYDYALEHNFRFLSYGDSSLLFAKP